MLNPQQTPVNDRLDIHDEASRKSAATLILNLFERWQLDTQTQLNLLGLSPNSRALLSKYRKGDPLPNHRDVLDRVGWLLACHKALRLLYPRNPELRYDWVNKRNEAFNAYTPLEIMREQGLLGIARVSRYLDFMRGPQ